METERHKLYKFLILVSLKQNNLHTETFKKKCQDRIIHSSIIRGPYIGKKNTNELYLLLR